MILLNGKRIEHGKYYSGEIYIEAKSFQEAVSQKFNIVKVENSNDFFYTQPENVLTLLLLLERVAHQTIDKKKPILELGYLPYSREDKDKNNIALLQPFLRILKNSTSTIRVSGDLHNKKPCQGKQIDIFGKPFWLEKLDEIEAKYGEVIIVLPDKGSYDRYSMFLKDKEYITCTKARVGGEIKKVELDKVVELQNEIKEIETTNSYTEFYKSARENLIIEKQHEIEQVKEKFESKACLVVDDICSGGKTFKEVADALPEKATKLLAIAYMENAAYTSGFNKDNLAKYAEVYFKELI